MSDKTHKILSLFCAVLFATAGAMLHVHRFPSLDWLWQVVMEITGGGSLIALKPLLNKPQSDAIILPGELAKFSKATDEETPKV